MHHTFARSLVILLIALSPCLADDDKKAAITDPAKAGPDFAVQGEYAGTLDGKKVGAQVVALGDDKFDLVIYDGGLPGDSRGGWKKGDKREKATGALKDGVVTFKTEKPTTIENGVLKLQAGELKKVERKSPTLGAKPPEGAKVLFGMPLSKAEINAALSATRSGAGGDVAQAATSLFAEEEAPNDFNPGTLTPDGYLKHGQTSKHKFTKSFTLHLEFRLPYQPYARGQGRANSGVYLSGGSEVQVLDSFGLEGKNNECGGFYSKREPDVNMCFPPLAWQTYDIEVTVPQEKDKKATATVKHNGVVIHKDFEIDFKSGGNLHLQDHGNPVAYRNIWIVER